MVWVSGFVNGVTHGYGLLDGAILLANPRFDPEVAGAVAAGEKRASNQMRQDFGRRSAGQLAAGLDVIYGNNKNKAIPIREAVIIVVRSMDGTPDGEIAKLIERKRAEASR